ncbi:MAG: hypothetical protein IIC67_10970 [Thaumarchaeota archaeon]|nr:hypothetical protein [Nitrososphaerota archaeon]
MGTQFKIKETQFFLNRLKENKRKLLIAMFYFSAFLTSSSSILYHLLAIYGDKYELNLKNITPKSFRKQANKKKNGTALKFIKWYDTKIEKLAKDKTCGKLRRLRHENVHHSLEMPTYQIMFSPPKGTPVGIITFQPATGVSVHEKEVKELIKKTSKDFLETVNKLLIERGEKPIKKVEKTIILNLSEIEYFELDQGCSKYFREIKKLVKEAETKFTLFEKPPQPENRS